MHFNSRRIPKIELHVHLDTCISYHCAKMLMPALNLKVFQSNFIAPSQCTDLGDFLRRISPQLSLLQTHTALRQAVEDMFDQLHADGVIYAELRFAPLLHLNQYLTAEEVIETVLDAMQINSHIFDIKANLILCTLRHFTAEQSLETARLVTKYLHYGLSRLTLQLMKPATRWITMLRRLIMYASMEATVSHMQERLRISSA